MKAAGWMTELIQRARTNGVANDDIAAALEDGIAFRPLTLGRDEGDRLVGVMTDADMTLDDLFNATNQNR